MSSHISLEQWRALVEVVDAGGYAQAAAKLCKSQSALSYAVQKIETQLGVKAFETQGRKAALTPTGQMLYRRAQVLLHEAHELEQAAKKLSAGWEAVINLATEILYPIDLLLAGLEQFGRESGGARIEILETVLSGATDALIKGEADLAITPVLPPGFLGDLILRVRLVAVAHADHPLHCLGRELSPQDLRPHRHIVVRDSGTKRDQCTMSVEIDRRWTVGQIATSIRAVSLGHGFAWLPEAHIREELASGLLKPLPLREGGVREAPLYLVVANPELAGPGVRRLAEILRAQGEAAA